MLKRIAKLLRIAPPGIDNPGLLLASGPTTPVDTTPGYQTGCIFQNTTDDQTPALYVNEGDYASCDFDPLDSLAQYNVGTSGLHSTNATSGGNVLGIFVDPTATTAARFTTAQVESLLAPETITVSGAGLYTGRFVAGFKAGTFKGAGGIQGYVAGVQGKLTATATSVIGDNNSGGLYVQAGLMQMQITAGATFGTDVNVSGLWVDNQVGAALPASSQLLNLTNNGGAVTALIHGYGNNAVAEIFSFDTFGTAIVAATGVTTISKALKIKIDGTTYYIPCCTGTT